MEANTVKRRWSKWQESNPTLLDRCSLENYYEGRVLKVFFLVFNFDPGIGTTPEYPPYYSPL